MIRFTILGIALVGCGPVAKDNTTGETSSMYSMSGENTTLTTGSGQALAGEMGICSESYLSQLASGASKYAMKMGYGDGQVQPGMSRGEIISAASKGHVMKESSGTRNLALLPGVPFEDGVGAVGVSSLSVEDIVRAACEVSGLTNYSSQAVKEKYQTRQVSRGSVSQVSVYDLSGSFSDAIKVVADRGAGIKTMMIFGRNSFFKSYDNTNGPTRGGVEAFLVTQ